MIFGNLSTAFVAELDGAPQGLVGTLQVGIFNEPAGTAVVAYTTAGITEETTGAATSTYYAALNAPAVQPAAGQKYVVKWKNGATIVTEDLLLSSLGSALLAPTGVADGLSFGELYGAYIEVSGVTPVRAKQRINQSYRRFAVKSECIRAKLDIATTLVGIGNYSLDNAIIGVYDPVRLDGKRLERKSADDIDDLNASQAYIVGRTNGFYAPEFDTVGGSLLKISTPTVAGKAITARVSLRPAAMVADGEYPKIPAEYHDSLVDGAFALGLGRDDERFEERAALLAEFDAGARECRGTLNRRVGAGGPARIRLAR